MTTTRQSWRRFARSEPGGSGGSPRKEDRTTKLLFLRCCLVSRGKPPDPLARFSRTSFAFVSSLLQCPCTHHERRRFERSEPGSLERSPRKENPNRGVALLEPYSASHDKTLRQVRGYLRTVTSTRFLDSSPRKESPNRGVALLEPYSASHNKTLTQMTVNVYFLFKFEPISRRILLFWTTILIA
jgi:hypothetical protein